MAYDEGLAQIFRDDLSDRSGITEQRMFGGICFLMNGNMLCGVHSGGGMARVGKDNEAAALKIEGVTPMSFTGRRMSGMVDVSAKAISDDERRAAVLRLAEEFVSALPPKAKRKK